MMVNSRAQTARSYRLFLMGRLGLRADSAWIRADGPQNSLRRKGRLGCVYNVDHDDAAALRLQVVACVTTGSGDRVKRLLV